MSITEAHTISEIHDSGPLTQQTLARRLRLQKSTVSRLIDELEGEGTVRRVPNPDDGRSVLVALTAGGRRRAKRLGDARTELFARLLEGMTRSDRQVIISGLAKLEAAANAAE